ncbi:AraC family transcriptional regulator [Actinomadura alba]|uniref:Helix-turn-helix domain-containing protein n=1 Tax=Actinomadura alba TaxID=406431 RepID=A0ABR7LR67_9ACTN|nr:helix-turn-helix domain-containing protein [Actinomadura alba]MBC6467274.1 helix-turn-helix domain-containing protein [Actinomadura alba]
MGLEFEDRSSESPYVERVWRSRSAGLDRMTSVATAHWNLVVWEEAGQARAAVQGPETRASMAPVPPDTTFFGIRFALGTTLPWLPIQQVVDGDLELPDVTRRRLWLDGAHWPLPDYDNAEHFVRRLVRAGVLVRDLVVALVLDGGTVELSIRSVRRHFVRATGLTSETIRQIERARQAASLLRDGSSIGDLTHDLGYFDHPHLARSLSRFIGRTATQLRRQPQDQVSLLYKPWPAALP